jgi:hypothetical protein
MNTARQNGEPQIRDKNTNRGNELNKLLKTKEVAFYEVQNELIISALLHANAYM